MRHSTKSQSQGISSFFVPFFYLFTTISILYLLFSKSSQVVVNNTTDEKIIIKDTTSTSTSNLNPYATSMYPSFFPSWNMLNWFYPPVRDERPLPYILPPPMQTNIGAVDTSYRQVGMLTATNTTGSVLPLLGRPLYTNRDKWQYYTISNQNNMIKMPVTRNGRSCTNEYGCDKLYSGDTVYISGINEVYRVTLYENNGFQY